MITWGFTLADRLGRFYDQLEESRAHVAEAYDPQIRERLRRISLELTGAPVPGQAATLVPPA